MQYIQNACLLNIFVSSVFLGPEHKPFNFTWDKIINHGLTFSNNYNKNDAAVLLQLSLMITESSYLKNNLNTPSSLTDITIMYDECPMAIFSKAMPSVASNEPTMIAHLFYIETSDTVIIAFTGTINGCMAAMDLSYEQIDADKLINYIPGLRAHSGIYLAYQSIRDKLFISLKPLLSKNPKIIVTGHSLGGGISQLCALDLAYYNPLHYSFASPMIFNDVGHRVFTELINSSYRVANLSDLVVLAPLPVMPNKDVFFHVGELIHFQRNMGEYSPNHTAAYIHEYNL